MLDEHEEIDDEEIDDDIDTNHTINQDVNTFRVSYNNNTKIRPQINNNKNKFPSHNNIKNRPNIHKTEIIGKNNVIRPQQNSHISSKITQTTYTPNKVPRTVTTTPPPTTTTTPATRYNNKIPTISRPKPNKRKQPLWSSVCKNTKPAFSNASVNNYNVSRVKQVTPTDDEKSPELINDDIYVEHMGIKPRRSYNSFNRPNNNHRINGYSGSSSTSSHSNNDSNRVTPSPSPPDNPPRNSRQRSNHNGNHNHSNSAKERRRVFVSNLPPSSNDDDIRGAFKYCGAISNTVWFPSRTDGKFYGSGLITFADHNGAREALRMNQQNVLGRIIRVEYSSCQDPVKVKPRGCRTIYLNNVPKDAQESEYAKYLNIVGRLRGSGFMKEIQKNWGCIC